MNIYTDRSNKRPAGIQFVAQVLGGCVTGLVLGGVAGLLGAYFFAGTREGWGDLIAAIVGATIGYTIGVPAGVYVIGSRLGRHGGYWLALLGSVLGVALVLLAAEPLHLNQNTAVLQT